jgi:hypothetical protein
VSYARSPMPSTRAGTLPYTRKSTTKLSWKPARGKNNPVQRTVRQASRDRRHGLAVGEDLRGASLQVCRIGEDPCPASINRDVSELLTSRGVASRCPEGYHPALTVRQAHDWCSCSLMNSPAVSQVVADGASNRPGPGLWWTLGALKWIRRSVSGAVLQLPVRDRSVVTS